MKLARALILATVAVTLAGCSSGKSDSTSTTSTTTPSSTTTATGTTTAMNVTEVDFKITGPTQDPRRRDLHLQDHEQRPVRA